MLDLLETRQEAQARSSKVESTKVQQESQKVTAVKQAWRKTAQIFSYFFRQYIILIFLKISQFGWVYKRQSGTTDRAGEEGSVRGEKRARGEAGPNFLPGPDGRS